MKPGSKCYLLQNETGAFSRILYGSQGDAVNIISLNADMAMVENNSNRFYVRVENISLVKPGIVQIQNLHEPTPEPINNIKKQAPATRKAKVVSTNQTQLF